MVSKKFNTLKLVLCLVIAMIVIVMLLKAMQAHKRIVDADAARDAGKPIPVASHTVAEGVLRPLLVGSCTAEPSKTLSIAGVLRDIMVKAVHAEPGGSIEAGSVLIEFDDRERKAGLERARDRIDWLVKRVDEKKTLLDYFEENLKDGQSLEVDYRRAKVDWIEAREDLAVARSDFQLAEIELSKTVLTAPASSIVDDIVLPGEVARQSVDLARLVVLNPLYMRCDFNIEDYNYIQTFKDQGKVAIRSLPGEVFSANFVKSVTEESGDGLRWIFSVNNEANRIQPGMSGYLRFSSEKVVVRVPTVALLNRHDSQAQVFIIEDDKARLTDVHIGQESGGYSEIKSGLIVDNVIVVAGQRHLINGDSVAVVDPLSIVYPYGK